MSDLFITFIKDDQVINFTTIGYYTYIGGLLLVAAVLHFVVNKSVTKKAFNDLSFYDDCREAITNSSEP